jgi:RNA-directed DNA polymerase
MNSSQFEKNEFKKLCALIGTCPEEVIDIVKNIDVHYREWHEIKINKATNKPKTYKDGTIKKRTISPPNNRLRQIQTKIKNKLLAPIQLPENIHGGVKKKSSISNSLPHKGKKYHFTTDLQDFFPRINNKQVNSALLSLKFSHHSAYWITKLITWKHKVPQGCPTSSHIANLTFLNTDNKLIEFCKLNNITYTRYVDDLTFSSPSDFKPLLNEILKIVIDGGYNISYRKTEYKGGSVLVTGIEIYNNHVDAPEKIHKKVAAEEKSDDPSKPYTIYLNNIRRTNSEKTKYK